MKRVTGRIRSMDRKEGYLSYRLLTLTLPSIIPFIFSIHPHVTHAVHPFGRRVTRGRVRRSRNNGVIERMDHGRMHVVHHTSSHHPWSIRSLVSRRLILYTLYHFRNSRFRVAMLQRLKGEVSTVDSLRATRITSIAFYSSFDILCGFLIFLSFASCLTIDGSRSWK